MEYIQGEKFMDLANNIDVFYRYTHDVNAFFKDLRMLNRHNFILVSHNGDGCITENPKRDIDADFKLTPSNLLVWYGQNVCVKDDRIKSLPIGLENNEWFPKVHKREKMIAKLKQPKEINNLVYMNFNIATNLDERLEPYQIFESKSWVTTEYGKNGFEFDKYINNIYNHKFVICPKGNGIDTVRTWETLYMGTIPIEKRNINNQFYMDLPICFVDDWNEITENFLEGEYIRIEQSIWNMDKLNFEYWGNKILSYKNNLMKINDRYMDLVDNIYKKSYLAYKKGASKPIETFSSHQPVLIHMLNTITEGDVLEFGMGDNSTPLMHTICGKQNRKLCSVDTNKEWSEKFENYENESHEIYRINVDLIRYSYEIFAVFQNKYSIVFIDNEPADLRQPFIDLISKNADYIIVHDSEEIALNDSERRKNSPYRYDFSKFRHVLHFKEALPSTTVLSNLDEIDENIFNIF